MSTIYEGWAVIEMMGHRKFAGKVTPVEGYPGLLTVEIPGAERPIIVGAGAIFQITPVDEDFAQLRGKSYLEASTWGASHLRQLLPVTDVEFLEAPDDEEQDVDRIEREHLQSEEYGNDDDRLPPDDSYDPENDKAPDGYFETDVDC